MATIHSIMVQPLDRPYKAERADYIRVPLATARLIAGQGIEGDRKAGGNPDRNLNLVSLEWLQSLAPRGYRTQPGEFGEQLIVSGMAIETLQPGTRLQLGEDVIIEISKPRTACDRFEAAQQGKPRHDAEPLGVMARVITGGTIKLGDTVRSLVAA